MISSKHINGKSNIIIRSHNNFANYYRSGANSNRNRRKSVEENIAHNFKKKPQSLINRFESFGIIKLDEIIQDELKIQNTTPISNHKLRNVAIDRDSKSTNNRSKGRKLTETTEQNSTHADLLQKYYNKANESYKVLV